MKVHKRSGSRAYAAVGFAFCAIAGIGTVGYLIDSHVSAQTANGNSAQTSNPPSAEDNPLEPRPPRQVEPVLIERKELPPGTVAGDPRRRMTFYPGGKREGCQPWRFEVSARSDGEIVIQVNEPADRQIVMAGRGDGRSQEFVLGDPDCSFRFKIERGK